MSMTREEAIEQLKRLDARFDMGSNRNDMVDFSKIREVIKLASNSLHPVSLEQVEQMWRGCSWCNNEGKKSENWECSLLDDRGFSVVVGDEVVWTNAGFCPVCGRPLTAETVQITMRRLEELKDAGSDH